MTVECFWVPDKVCDNLCQLDRLYLRNLSLGYLRMGKLVSA